MSLLVSEVMMERRLFFFFFNDTATTEIYTSFPTRRSSDLVRPMAGAALESHDRIPRPIDDAPARHPAAVRADDRPAPELGEGGREIADVRRLVLLDEIGRAHV